MQQAAAGSHAALQQQQMQQQLPPGQPQQPVPAVASPAAAALLHAAPGPPPQQRQLISVRVVLARRRARDLRGCPAVRVNMWDGDPARKLREKVGLAILRDMSYETRSLIHGDTWRDKARYIVPLLLRPNGGRLVDEQPVRAASLPPDGVHMAAILHTGCAVIDHYLHDRDHGATAGQPTPQLPIDARLPAAGKHARSANGTPASATALPRDAPPAARATSQEPVVDSSQVAAVFAEAAGWLRPSPATQAEAEASALADRLRATQLGQLLASALHTRDLGVVATIFQGAGFAAGDATMHNNSFSLSLAGSDLAGAVGQAQRWHRLGIGVREGETVGVAVPNPAPLAENRATFHAQGSIFASDARQLVDGLLVLLGVLPGQGKQETWIPPSAGLLRALGPPGLGTDFVNHALLAFAAGFEAAEGAAAAYASPSGRNTITRIELVSASPAGVLGVAHAITRGLGLPARPFSSWMRGAAEAVEEGEGEDVWEADSGADGGDEAAAGADAAEAAGRYEPAGNRRRAPPFTASDEPAVQAFLHEMLGEIPNSRLAVQCLRAAVVLASELDACQYSSFAEISAAGLDPLAGTPSYCDWLAGLEGIASCFAEAVGFECDSVQLLGLLAARPASLQPLAITPRSLWVAAEAAIWAMAQAGQLFTARTMSARLLERRGTLERCTPGQGAAPAASKATPNDPGLAFLNPAAAAARDTRSGSSQPLAVVRFFSKPVTGAVAYGLLWAPGPPCSARKPPGLAMVACRFDRVHPGAHDSLRKLLAARGGSTAPLPCEMVLQGATPYPPQHAALNEAFDMVLDSRIQAADFIHVAEREFGIRLAKSSVAGYVADKRLPPLLETLSSVHVYRPLLRSNWLAPSFPGLAAPCDNMDAVLALPQVDDTPSELPSPSYFALLAGTSGSLADIDRQLLRRYSAPLGPGSVVAVADRSIVAAYTAAHEHGDVAATQQLLRQHQPRNSSGQPGLPVDCDAAAGVAVFMTCPLPVLERLVGPADQRQLAPVWHSVRGNTDVVDVCPAPLLLVAEDEHGTTTTVQGLRVTLSTTVLHLVQTLVSTAAVALEQGPQAAMQLLVGCQLPFLPSSLDIMQHFEVELSLLPGRGGPPLVSTRLHVGQKDSVRFLLRSLTREIEWDEERARGMRLRARLVRTTGVSERSCVPAFLLPPPPPAPLVAEDEPLFGILAEHIRPRLQALAQRAGSPLFQQVLSVSAVALGPASLAMQQLLEAFLEQEEQLGQQHGGGDRRGEGTAFALLQELPHALLSMAKSAPDITTPLYSELMEQIEQPGCIICPGCKAVLPSLADSCGRLVETGSGVRRCGYRAPAWRNHDEARRSRVGSAIKYDHKGGSKADAYSEQLGLANKRNKLVNNAMLIRAALEHVRLVTTVRTWKRDSMPHFHCLGGSGPATARLVAAAYWAALRELFASYME